MGTVISEHENGEWVDDSARRAQAEGELVSESVNGPNASLLENEWKNERATNDGRRSFLFIYKFVTILF